MIFSEFCSFTQQLLSGLESILNIWLEFLDSFELRGKQVISQPIIAENVRANASQLEQSQ